MNRKQQEKIGENRKFNFKIKKEYLDYGRLHNDVKKFYSEDKDCFDFFTKHDNFSVKGVNVQIQNREVPNWSQPIILNQEIYTMFFKASK